MTQNFHAVYLFNPFILLMEDDEEILNLPM